MLKLSSVLLVDDDPRTNELNERLLRPLDVADRYCAATDGADALAALQDLAAGAQPTSPVLVLLDVKMPGMDGMAFVEVYQQLLADRRQAMVIIMHTNSMNSSDLSRIESLPIARRSGQQAPNQGKARYHPTVAFSAPLPNFIRLGA